MNNFDYIFKYNSFDNSYRIRFSNKKQIICDINNYKFGADVINRVICFVQKLNISLRGFPIIFRFNNRIRIADKLSYIIFECICYCMVQRGYNVNVVIDYEHDIRTCGIECAPVNLLIKGNCKKFVEKFSSEIFKNHYCKLITDKVKDNPAFLSLLYSDIDTFLKGSGINDIRRNDISETISELIGNACEHTTSDCYIDIDVTDDYYKNVQNQPIDTSTTYFGVNIVILNYSDRLLNHDIKEKMKIYTAVKPDRYKKLLEAYNYHKQFFDNSYTEDDFFNIAVFQNKISGSIEKEDVGGTGLTYLINSLQKKSDNDDCYVLSGNNILYFHRDYLSYQNDWIGFNSSNDFFNSIPDKKLIDRSKVFLAGTAYNLNFVMKSEDNNEQFG